MARLLRSTLAQSFSMSAAHAVRRPARGSALAGAAEAAGGCVCSSVAGRATVAPSLRRVNPVVTTWSLRPDAARDHGLRLVHMRHRDGALADAVLRPQDVGEGGVVGSSLDGGGRNHHDAFERVDEQADIDELPRPQLQAGVGKLRLHPDRPGRRVDLVVDDLQGAAIELFAVGAERLDRQRLFRLRRVDLKQLLLRQGEEHAHRAQLGDHDDAGIAGTHQVAFVDHADAGAPVDGRDDGGVLQERLGVGDGGVVEPELGRELVDQRLLGVDGLLGDDVAAELGVALEVAMGIGELGLVERLLGDGLVELGLVGGGIDPGDDVAALDLLPLLEIDAEDAAVDLRAYGHRAARLGGAHAFQVERHIVDAGRRHRDRNRARQHLGRPAAGELFLHRRQHRGVDDDAGHRRGDSEPQRAPDQPARRDSWRRGALSHGTLALADCAPNLPEPIRRAPRAWRCPLKRGRRFQTVGRRFRMNCSFRLECFNLLRPGRWAQRIPFAAALARNNPAAGVRPSGSPGLTPFLHPSSRPERCERYASSAPIRDLGRFELVAGGPG